ARVDEQPLFALAEAVLDQEPVDPIGIGQLRVVDERRRLDPQGLYLLGRHRHRARLDPGAIELQLQLFERTGGLLLERWRGRPSRSPAA
ncbi:MAG TPA: hypothetical protein VGI39_28665, partial [Polyangiaceae bacterium]